MALAPAPAGVLSHAVRVPSSARPALAAHALGALRAVCAGHPNPRRVFAAIVGRLLVPVLGRAFSAARVDASGGSRAANVPGRAFDAIQAAVRTSTPAAGGQRAVPSANDGAAVGLVAGAASGAAEAAAEKTLVAACLALLEAVVFARVHVHDLAGLCAAAAAADAAAAAPVSAGAAAADAAVPPAATDAALEVGGAGSGVDRKLSHAPRSYHWQLFQVGARPGKYAIADAQRKGRLTLL